MANGKTGAKGRGVPALKCLKCGGNHPTADCPRKNDSAQAAEEDAEVAFTAFEESPEIQLSDSDWVPEEDPEVASTAFEESLSVEDALMGHRGHH